MVEKIETSARQDWETRLLSVALWALISSHPDTPLLPPSLLLPLHSGFWRGCSTQSIDHVSICIQRIDFYEESVLNHIKRQAYMRNAGSNDQVRFHRKIIGVETWMVEIEHG